MRLVVFIKFSWQQYIISYIIKVLKIIEEVEMLIVVVLLAGFLFLLGLTVLGIFYLWKSSWKYIFQVMIRRF